MSVSDRDLAATLAALKSRNCHVNRDWLTECVNFFRSENNQYSLQDLENFVLDQWLLGDLKEIASCGSFPPNLSNILKITLEGKMACQIESYTDIGHSAYNQMQKVRNEDVGNVQVDENKEFQQAWEPKSNRCLQLILCDGTQVVRAIEYKPISFFKTDMMPGIKILLHGPIECRRGVFLLEEKHVTILGGEVDALVIINAYENVLARKLNLQENPDPYNMTAQPAVAQIQPSNQTQPQPLQGQQQILLHQVAPQVNVANDTPQQPLTGNNAEYRRQQKKPTTLKAPEQAKKLVQTSLSWTKQPCGPAPAIPPQTPLIEFSGNDEDFMDIPLDAADWDEEMNYESIPATENQTSTASWGARTLNTNASSTAEFDDVDEALLLEASLALETKATKPPIFAQKNFAASAPVVQKKVMEETVSSKRLASSALSEESLKKPLFAKRRKETSSQEVTSSTDLNFPQSNDLIDFNDPVEVSTQIPMIFPSHPFVYLSQMNQSEVPNTCRVKAAVITIIDKLCISENEWKLSAKITDGSANVDVKFSDKVLEELFGMSATEMSEMKKQIVQQPEKKDIIRKKLEKAQYRLINLNCLLDIKISQGDLPLVVGFEDISSSTRSALTERQRLSKS